MNTILITCAAAAALLLALAAAPRPYAVEVSRK